MRKPFVVHERLLGFFLQAPSHGEEIGSNLRIHSKDVFFCWKIYLFFFLQRGFGHHLILRFGSCQVPMVDLITKICGSLILFIYTIKVSYFSDIRAILNVA